MSVLTFDMSLKRSCYRNIMKCELFYTKFGIHRTHELSAYSFIRINIIKENWI